MPATHCQFPALLAGSPSMSRSGEDRRPFLPRHAQATGEERGRDHARAVVHPPFLSELTHARVDERHAGHPVRPRAPALPARADRDRPGAAGGRSWSASGRRPAAAGRSRARRADGRRPAPRAARAHAPPPRAATDSRTAGTARAASPRRGPAGPASRRSPRSRSAGTRSGASVRRARLLGPPPGTWSPRSPARGGGRVRCLRVVGAAGSRGRGAVAAHPPTPGRTRRRPGTRPCPPARRHRARRRSPPGWTCSWIPAAAHAAARRRTLRPATAPTSPVEGDRSAPRIARHAQRLVHDIAGPNDQRSAQPRQAPIEIREALQVEPRAVRGARQHRRVEDDQRNDLSRCGGRPEGGMVVHAEIPREQDDRAARRRHRCTDPSRRIALPVSRSGCIAPRLNVCTSSDERTDACVPHALGSVEEVSFCAWRRATKQDRLSISQVSELLGIPVPTIRSWERRYDFPSPARTEGKHRRYAPDEIDRLRSLRDEITTRSPGAQGRGTRPLRRPRVATRSEFLDRFTDAATALDVDGVRRSLDQAVELVGVERAIVEVAMPGMRELGDQWQSGRCDVATEHAATGVVRQWFARLSAATPPPFRSRPLVLATGPTELHTIGLEAFAVLLGRRGWPIRMLGALTPTDALVAALMSSRAAGNDRHRPAQRRAARGDREPPGGRSDLGSRRLLRGQRVLDAAIPRGRARHVPRNRPRGRGRARRFGDPLSAVNTIVEIAVGIACLLAAVGTWRREGLRWISILLGVAGLAAVGHALISLG